MKRALGCIGLLLAGCYDFKARFNECRDAGKCVDDEGPAVLEAFGVLPNFLPAEVGSPSVGRAMTVRNVGAQTSGLISVSIDGGAFSVEQVGCVGQRLDPAAECEVRLRFTPPDAGSFTAQVFASAEPGGTVSGVTTGFAQQAATLMLTPGNKNFLKVIVGQDSAPTTFTVQNLGPGRADGIFVSIDAGAFVPVANGCSALAPTASCSVDVVFRATSPAGVTRGELAVAWGNARRSVSAQLSGESVLPSSLLISPSPHSFMDVNTGAFADQTFTVSTANANPSGVLSVALSDAGSPAFSIVGGSCPGEELVPPETCTVTVRFTPQGFGSEMTNLEIGDGLGPPAFASLSGRGIDLVAVQVRSDGGDGFGRVLSDGGLDCGAACVQQVRRFTPVDLTAAPLFENEFQGWGGACAGAGLDASCTVIASAPDTLATAAFGRYRTLTLTPGFGQVSVSPTGDVCPPSCTLRLPPSTTAVLTAVPTNPFQAHAGWTGCTDDGGTCAAAMTQDRAVTALYSPYNRVFVTSTPEVAGQLGNLFQGPPSDPLRLQAVAAAHQWCQAHAADAGLPGAYRAWVSVRDPMGVAVATDSINGIDLTSFHGWVRPDGRPIGPSFQPVWYPIRLDERGRDVGSVVVFTGTENDGTWRTSNQHCGQLRNPDGGFIDYGISSGMQPEWTVADSGFSYMPPRSCSTPVRLYCYGVNTKHATRPPRAPPGTRRAFLSTGEIIGPTTQASADAVCQAEAAAAGLSGTFGVLRATAGGAAAAAFPDSGVGWYRMDGAALFASAAALRAQPPLTALNITVDGGVARLIGEEGARVYTGAPNPYTAGTAASTCDNWSNGSGSAQLGAARDSVLWFWDGNTPAGGNECLANMFAMSPKRVYCFER